MKIEFKQEELISKNGKTYPVVGGRLRVAHDQNDRFDISTEMIRFESGVEAVVKAEVQIEKGAFHAYGAASLAKDERLAESLLELAETRAIARALRFAGYGVEYTGSEEVPMEETTFQREPEAFVSSQPKTFTPPQSKVVDGATRPQLHAIEKISTLKGWNALECCRKILKRQDIINLHSLTKNDASEVISRMKEVA